MGGSNKLHSTTISISLTSKLFRNRQRNPVPRGEIRPSCRLGYAVGVTQPFRFYPAIEQWFEQKFGPPTLPQDQGWPAIQSGAHTLIAAPTGSGKTLAAFLASLDWLFRDGLAGNLKDETTVLYVSPLKALSNDIHKNLEKPLAGICAALRASDGRNVEVRAEVRPRSRSICFLLRCGAAVF